MIQWPPQRADVDHRGAGERLAGLVLTALAVEMLLSGVRPFVGELAR